ncbi:hypothetical protein CASFOL_030476 [Castilleja foliolosa]|uniref:Uncharacterized protein n=1 Tax=Castilleja foliolosa TaxID=1961234 RepID=A0ABD3CA76_9LAMI
MSPPIPNPSPREPPYHGREFGQDESFNVVLVVLKKH